MHVSLSFYNFIVFLFLYQLILVIFYILYTFNHVRSITIHYSCIYSIFIITLFMEILYAVLCVFDLFGGMLLMLCGLIGFLTLISSNLKMKEYLAYGIILYSFNLITYFLVTTDNLLIMFICYESFMMLSLILLYISSYTRKSFNSILYFFVWTQFGSLLVLVGIIYLCCWYGLHNLEFYKPHLILNNTHNFIVSFLFFIGFGIKIPIFPLHGWLINVHVEASTSFSIFLSGFLVKTALFFYVKIVFYMFNGFLHFLFLFSIIYGIANSTIKFWTQIDLKKIVAYATIQEMNMLLLMFMYCDQRLYFITILFCMGHGLTSAFMFYTVDLLYKRFHSRMLDEVTGVWVRMPKLGAIILIQTFIFVGMPIFIKFTFELYFYFALFSITWVLGVCGVALISVIGALGYITVWFTVLFSPVAEWWELDRAHKFFKSDVTTSEWLLCYFFIAILLTLNFVLI